MFMESIAKKGLNMLKSHFKENGINQMLIHFNSEDGEAVTLYCENGKEFLTPVKTQELRDYLKEILTEKEIWKEKVIELQKESERVKNK